MIKLHKNHCYIKIVRGGDEPNKKTGKPSALWNIFLIDKYFGSMTIPGWEAVSLWYQLGDLLGFDRDDAKYELERLHWKHDQGELDEPSQKIVGRKNRNSRK